MTRKFNQMIGTYFDKTRMREIDELTTFLFNNRFIDKNNRSEMFRFAIEFLSRFVETAKYNIEGIKTVRDYLILEELLPEGDLASMVAMSTNLLTDNIINGIGSKLAGSQVQ